jgi:hypothetical protein
VQWGQTRLAFALVRRKPQMDSRPVHREHAALTLAHLLCLVLRPAFFHFRSANRVCASFGANPRILLIALSMHAFHELHIRHQPDPKACGWRNNCPRPAQRLTYGHTPNQTYATKHDCSSFCCSANVPKNPTARMHAVNCRPVTKVKR